MIKTLELRIPLAKADDPDFIKLEAAKKARIAKERIYHLKIQRRSIDARKHPPKFVLKVEIYIDESAPIEEPVRTAYRPVSSGKKVIIVGSGPAGYFAALELISAGIKPIIFDRGKEVQARRRDLRQITQEGIVNPHSNYCFGEGGAGTYSDGKLYTRATKRGHVGNVLQILVEHGAPADILTDAHPHIGSNKLPQVVQNIRRTILEFGGEIHFEAPVTDLIRQGDEIRGVIVSNSTEHLADAVILATGHSARDIFELLHRHQIWLESKPFAVGLRLEHPQPLIDQIQYGSPQRDPLLPAASYRMTGQVGNRGVFTFCMCPGGWIVPAATAPGELVLNGMSLSRRDNEFANAGLVVTVLPEDLQHFKKFGALAGVKFQQKLERKAFKAGGGITQCAPAQRLVDFVDKKLSKDLGPTSYTPGIVSAPLHEILPKNMVKALAEGALQFGRKMQGFYTNEAQLLAIESRTSSPVRIPRDEQTLKHVQIRGLYPAGEGAGYAGGIVSAALDGQNVARAIAASL